MPLTRGTRLGPYEIVAEIGAGGMGEVYKARDTRLGRTVAIKTLSASISTDSRSKERLEQEARAISNLNHPHICVLHDVGEQDGMNFLVMEYLDGRPIQGPLPVNLALKYAIQIADALDTAHSAGIIHRDLKPGNILLAKNEVKLLDFGLAKLRLSPVVVGTSTATLPLTAENVLVGTPRYMAPEQLERKEADARSDIFAFGCVLYEMLTGRPAFNGNSTASVIAAVLRAEPEPLARLQPGTPTAVARIVERCLAKDPEERWQTVRDLRAELQWVHQQPAAATVIRTTSRTRLLWTAPLGALLLAGGAGWLAARYVNAESEPAAMRFVAPPPPGTTYDSQRASVRAPQVALSPDGRYLAFVATKSPQFPMLWIRRLDDATAKALPGTEDASAPFWSPDSRSIGFFARGKLLRIDKGGGPIQRLADVTDHRGATWAASDVIVYAPTSGGLFQVSAKGGEARAITQLNAKEGEGTHRWPCFLPDGKHVLFQVRGATEESRAIHVASLDGTVRKKLVRANSGAIYAQGHLLYVDGATLVAQPFDPKTLEVTGEKKPLAEPAGMTSTGYPSVTVSTNNVLVYGEQINELGRLTWHNRSGAQSGTVAEIADYLDFRLSPDVSKVVFARLDSKINQQDIWIADTRGATWRFTADEMTDASAQWSPDGETIYFRSTRRGVSDVFRKPSSGGPEEVILDRTHHQPEPSMRSGALITTDCTRDGKFLVFTTSSATKGFDIWALPLDGGKPIPQIEAEFNEMHGNVSPDGRWLAYTTDESGSHQVNVRPFPVVAATASQWPVSTHGGSEPRWKRDGTELYYMNDEQQIMVVPVTAGARFNAGIPRVLFATKAPKNVSPYRSRYDVSPDGQRFLVFNLESSDAAAASLPILIHWQKFLER